MLGRETCLSPIHMYLAPEQTASIRMRVPKERHRYGEGSEQKDNGTDSPQREEKCIEDLEHLLYEQILHTRIVF